MSAFTEQLNIRVGILFSKLGIPPNAWTLLSLLPAFAGFAALYKQELLLGMFFFALSSCVDAVDGAVARVTNSVSNLGGFLNGVIERYVEILFYVGLFLYLQDKPGFVLPNSLWVMLLLFGSMMPDFIRAYADHKKVVTDADDLKRMQGFFGRSFRLVLTYFGMLLGHFELAYLVYVIALTAAMVNVAAIQRVFFVAGKGMGR